jgi:hypothetical protein
MNTKITTFVTLALLLAVSASAQVVTILPGGRGNIYIGTPSNLPGPAANIVISPRISLPAPLLTPAVAMTLAPVPMAAAIPVLPVALPSAIPLMPIALPSPLPSDIVYHVAERAMPRALQAHFAAPAKDAASPKDVIAARERLDNAFDGSKLPNETRIPADERGPVRSDRHHSLPENDLEREIGAY